MLPTLLTLPHPLRSFPASRQSRKPARLPGHRAADVDGESTVDIIQILLRCVLASVSLDPGASCSSTLWPNDNISPLSRLTKAKPLPSRSPAASSR